MTAHRQLVLYQSILQVLHEPGCPFCKFLKEYQTGRLQYRSDVETRCLCIPHAAKLRRQLPPILASRLDAMVQNYQQQLKEELNQLRNEPSSNRSGWGTLGRVAEFLVSQRGLRA